jgi:hypothetical protein
LHSEIAYGQRVLKWQPDGGFIGEGTSPFKIIRVRFGLSSREEGIFSVSF